MSPLTSWLMIILGVLNGYEYLRYPRATILLRLCTAYSLVSSILMVSLTGTGKALYEVLRTF